MKKILLGVILAFTVIALSACAAGSNPLVDQAAPDGTLAGFWPGLWHGVIAPITFIVSLFNENVSIYEVYNSGGWYNFGFVLGAGVLLGGGSGGAATGKRRSRAKR